MSDMLKQRREKVERLKGLGAAPYGGRFVKDGSLCEAAAGFEEEKEVSAAGRITAIRGHGKTVFANISDISGQIQIYLRRDALGEQKFSIFENLDVGDIIGVKGRLFKTRTGEVTIKVVDLIVLSKSLRGLPEKWHGLKDVEIRYRQRYLDLISNEEVRRVFLLRSRIISKIRAFLDGRGFLEVETPMMQSIPGGALAKPFVTHHNALGIDLYLRIAPELFLKRLLVGGFEKIYELNRNFRNEGLSRRHNPEFSMLEVYAAYADCETMMALTEEMIGCVAEEVLGNREFSYQEKPLNLSAPWQRCTFFGILEEETGADLRKEGSAAAVAERFNIESEKGEAEIDIINKIFEKVVEPKLSGPIFITDYPAILCPLSKRKDTDPELTDRFELFIGGQEVANAYSELNDPLEQRMRFEEQHKGGLKDKLEGEDMQKIDEDFLLALEYGMPPAGGLGIGIDRLVMVLTNQSSIRDVILFPQLKSK